MWHWLRLSDQAIALDHGVIPAADDASYAELGSLLQALRTELQVQQAAREQMQARIRQEAAALMEAARADAERLLQAARDEADALCEASRAEGFEAGLDAAATLWHERHHELSLEQSASLQAQRHRLAGVIVAAVERIARGLPAAALFERALAEIDELARGGGQAVLRVSPGDVEAARSRVAAAAPRCRIEVLGDATLAPGGCVFESELGMLDASLEVQLAALREAVGQLLMHEDHPAADGDEAVAVAQEVPFAEDGEAGRGDDESSDDDDRPDEQDEDGFDPESDEDGDAQDGAGWGDDEDADRDEDEDQDQDDRYEGFDGDADDAPAGHASGSRRGAWT